MESLGAEIVDYRLLDYTARYNNPSGVLSLRKSKNDIPAAILKQAIDKSMIWICPLTGAELQRYDNFFYAADIGIAYPVFQDIPLMHVDHMIIASQLRVG